MGDPPGEKGGILFVIVYCEPPPFCSVTVSINVLKAQNGPTLLDFNIGHSVYPLSPGFWSSR